MRPSSSASRPADRDSVNHRSKQHLIASCLDLWFAESLTREARDGGRAVCALAGALGASRVFMSYASSSTLRLFESSTLTVRTSQRAYVSARQRKAEF